MLPKKIFFHHIPKTGGSYVIRYLTKILDVPIVRPRVKSQGVWNDFTIDELAELSKLDNGFISTHSLMPLESGWPDLQIGTGRGRQEEVRAIQKLYRDRGWFIFTFLRDPRHILCSLYFYVRDGIDDPNGRFHWPWFQCQSLDEFLANSNVLSMPNPKDFDFCAVLSDCIFSGFTQKYFNHSYSPGVPRVNVSSNKGYEFYCNNGWISESTQRSLICDEDYSRFVEIRDSKLYL